MKRLFVALACLSVGCTGLPDAAPGPVPSSNGPPAATPPLTRQASAPGLCGMWSESPLDLGQVGAPALSTSLTVKADARGGFSVIDVDEDGTWTAQAFTASGAADGPALVLPPADASSPRFDVVATTGGWVVAQAAGTDLTLLTLSPDGATTAQVSVPVSQTVQHFAYLDGGDGLVLVRADDGGEVLTGWMRDATHVDFDFTLWTGPLTPPETTAWSSGTFYGFDPAEQSVHAINPQGVTHDVPLTSRAASVAEHVTLVPGIGGESALLILPPASSQTNQPGAGASSFELVFVSSGTTDDVLTFDPEAARVAGAPRDASGGAVLAFTTDGLTAEGGVAYGFTEVSPGGARGEIHALGNEVIASRSLSLARSSDGSSYLVVAENVGVRSAYILTCSD